MARPLLTTRVYIPLPRPEQVPRQQAGDLGGFLLQDLDGIAHLDLPARQHLDKDAFPREDAVARLVVDSTRFVAHLADLCDPDQHLAQP